MPRQAHDTITTPPSPRDRTPGGAAREGAEGILDDDDADTPSVDDVARALAEQVIEALDLGDLREIDGAHERAIDDVLHAGVHEVCRRMFVWRARTEIAEFCADHLERALTNAERIGWPEQVVGHAAMTEAIAMRVIDERRIDEYRRACNAHGNRLEKWAREKQSAWSRLLAEAKRETERALVVAGRLADEVRALRAEKEAKEVK